jgi:hypothetical protein
MAVDVKDALLFYQRNPSLTEDDRAHIVRWLAVARDPIWQKIYAEFEANDEIPNIQGGLFCFVIGIALRYRAYAEKAKYETAKVRRRREQKREELCEKLLSLASDVEDVVERLRDYRKERRPPSESGNSPSVLKAKQALEWLESEVKSLRHMAEPRGLAWGEVIPITVSRQSGGRGKRPRSRAVGLFIKQMVNLMYRVCRGPRYEYVASLTNVAFPDGDVGAEEVRQNCRRRRTGTLGD